MNRLVSNTYSQQWNLTVEREIAAETGLRVSYIGNKGTRVPWYTYERNLPVTQAPGAIQGRRPYQPWASISTLDTNGSSTTQQLQIEVTRRYRSGLYLQSNYTFNKTLDNVPIVGTPQNPYNAALDRGNGDQIRRHVAYSSVTYELPFGPGRKYANAKGPVGYVIGGWSTATLLQFRGGSPFSVGFTPNQAGWYATRADQVSSSFYPAEKGIEGWFNPAAFATPAPFTFGNSSRNMLWGPGQKIVDVSFLKDVPFGEGRYFQFRAEFFNFPNTPSFSNPSANISTPGTVGKIRGVSVEPRAIQFGAKIVF